MGTWQLPWAFQRFSWPFSWARENMTFCAKLSHLIITNHHGLSLDSMDCELPPSISSILYSVVFTSPNLRHWQRCRVQVGICLPLDQSYWYHRSAIANVKAFDYIWIWLAIMSHHYHWVTMMTPSWTTIDHYWPSKPITQHRWPTINQRLTNHHHQSTMTRHSPSVIITFYA